MKTGEAHAGSDRTGFEKTLRIKEALPQSYYWKELGAG
jgi:hypothetical protein